MFSFRCERKTPDVENLHTIRIQFYGSADCQNSVLVKHTILVGRKRKIPWFEVGFKPGPQSPKAGKKNHRANLIPKWQNDRVQAPIPNIINLSEAENHFSSYYALFAFKRKTADFRSTHPLATLPFPIGQPTLASHFWIDEVQDGHPGQELIDLHQ